MCYGPWGHKESDMTERLTLSFSHTSWYLKVWRPDSGRSTKIMSHQPSLDNLLIISVQYNNVHLCSFQISMMNLKQLQTEGSMTWDICHCKINWAERTAECLLVFIRICLASLMEKRWCCGMLETNPFPFCNPCLSDHAQTLNQNFYLLATTGHLAMNAFFPCLVSEIISESSLENRN